MPRLRTVLPVVGAALILVLGGCAGEKAQPEATSPTTTVSPTPNAGDAVPPGVAAQYATLNEEIAEHGGETTSGAWRVGYIIEDAEAWYVPEGDGYTFREPAPGETNHIEIIPFETSTGRVVPDVPIRLEILDDTGKVVEAKDLNFYYSDFFHYANNFAIPAPGRYTLRATLGAPTFMRHGERDQPPALAEGATVEFTGVEITPGG